MKPAVELYKVHSLIPSFMRLSMAIYAPGLCWARKDLGGKALTRLLNPTADSQLGAQEYSAGSGGVTRSSASGVLRS